MTNSPDEKRRAQAISIEIKVRREIISTIRDQMIALAKERDALLKKAADDPIEA